MEDMIRNGMAICIELRDAFTNKCIPSSFVKLRVNGRKASLVKEGRFFVFQNIGEDKLDIQVQADTYEKKEWIISRGQYREKTENVPYLSGIFIQMQEVFLYSGAGMELYCLFLPPAQDYKLPRGCVCKEVHAEAYEMLSVVKNPEKPFFLIEDYRGGELLDVKIEGECAGNCFRIQDRDGNYEDFAVSGRKGKQLAIDRPLSGQYIKGNRIHALYCTRADGNGRAVLMYYEGKRK